MPTDIKLLMRKRDEALKRQQEVLDGPIGRNDGLTTAERREYDRLRREADDYGELIREQQRIENERAGVTPDQPAITVQLGDPQSGQVRSTVAFGDHGGQTRGFMRNDARTNHVNLGEFVRDCRWPTEAAQRGFQLTVGGEGGFFMPDQFLAQVFYIPPENAIVRPRATILPPNESYPDAKTGVPVLDHTEGILGGIKVYWLSEGGEKPEVSGKLELVELEPREMAAHTIVTDKALRNDAGAISTFLEKVFREALYDEEDYQCLCGDGVGKPLGILNCDARIEVARDTTSDFKFADVAAMMVKFLYSALNPVWVINATALARLIAMVDAGNHRVYIGADPGKRLPPSLLGIPVFFTGRTPTLGSTGDVMLCDFSYYLLRTGSGPFIEANPFFKFTENKTVVKCHYNVDGMPWLHFPMTLRDGTTQQSPFVVLKE